MTLASEHYKEEQAIVLRHLEAGNVIDLRPGGLRTAARTLGLSVSALDHAIDLVAWRDAAHVDGRYLRLGARP